MKSKILKTISVLIAIIIIVICGFFILKTAGFWQSSPSQGPRLPDQMIVRAGISSPMILEDQGRGQTVTQETLPKSGEEKYIIKNRNLVVPKDKNGNKKVVLLTIDDGPSRRTLQMVDILKKHNAKAIFFINGMHDKNNPGVIAEIQKEGFIIGNHTWGHLNLKREVNLNIIEKEITRNSDLIFNLTGSMPRFFRPPYGESTPYVRSFVKDKGMIFMNWSNAALDWEKSTIEKDIFVGNVTKNLAPGSIILIHEYPWSLTNLDTLLTTLESLGYTYVDPNNIIEK